MKSTCLCVPSTWSYKWELPLHGLYMDIRDLNSDPYIFSASTSLGISLVQGCFFFNIEEEEDSWCSFLNLYMPCISASPKYSEVGIYRKHSHLREQAREPCCTKHRTEWLPLEKGAAQRTLTPGKPSIHTQTQHQLSHEWAQRGNKLDKTKLSWESSVGN